MVGRLADKVVIVTGSSSGIGQAVLLAFAAEGATVVVHGTNSERIQHTRDLLKALEINEDRILVVQGAIEEEATQQQLVDETIKKFGKINVLVNNAAVARKPGIQESVSLENLDHLYRISFRSIFTLTEKAVPFLKETQGSIINTGSIAPSVNTVAPELCPYAMVKSMLDMYTIYQAIRLKPQNIRINTVSAGPFETNLLYSRFKFPLSGDEQTKFDEYRKNLVSRIPVGKFGDLEGIAAVYIQLALNPLVSGCNWAVDGGCIPAAIPAPGNVHLWDEIGY